MQLYRRHIPGRQDQTCLVFLHEGLGCDAMWKRFPDQLCEWTGLSGLVYDRLGYGQSAPLDKPRTVHYLHEYALSELPKIVGSQLADRDYILVGHSDGGSIALLHAAEQAVRLKGIITAAAHVFVEEITLAGIHQAQSAWHAGKLAGLARYHGEKTAALFHAWADTWLSPGFAHWNIEYALPSITCPLLALQGANDQYGSAAQLHAIAGKTRHGSQLILPNCGHSPHLEAPQAMLEAAALFIRTHCLDD
ncbi:alpha/beta fold hydrolase [Chromobacterium vaccinii]|uniref:alpha/beta fold hydrolase n=1 Tax=Chromobacterium vaccinii TaxID=1108595 RepID=UPI000E15DDB5|nr:alpha/beta hydrolase [Chromobacterium vaccinii]SUX54297.1 2-succinyl-6-hydroxy-2,4-cyclohexadiene-1-carboxylate synthase [Chromobacterium vaccinii]